MRLLSREDTARVDVDETTEEVYKSVHDILILFYETRRSRGDTGDTFTRRYVH
jgi:hypothetical protein